jgi:hypothetical protein
MRLVLFLAILFIDLCINAQIVNIPDANFKKALVENLAINTNGDNEIQYNEAQAFTDTINVSFLDISDLTGIESFSNLTGLGCYTNQITTLDVTKNIALLYFICSNNQLTTLDVSKNTALNLFHCSHNQIGTIDISKNKTIQSLSCSQNQLTSLDCSNNIALSYLSCSDNLLETLDLRNNYVLDRLYCDNNKLTKINIDNNYLLTTLFCQSNHLKKLDVSNNTNLVDFSCRYNYIKTLDASSNTSLIRIFCQDNQLVSLNIKNGNNNKIADLMTHGNPDLTCIEVDNPNWSASHLTLLDPWTSFSNNCYYSIPEFVIINFKTRPNPFSEILTVTLSHDLDIENTEITLYNILSERQSISIHKSNNEIKISVGNLKQGIYFLVLKEHNGLIGFSKLIKE